MKQGNSTRSFVQISKAYLPLSVLMARTNDDEAVAVFISVCNKCLVNDRAREQ